MLFYHMMVVKAASPDSTSCRLKSLAEHQGSLRMLELSCFWEKIAPAFETEIVLRVFEQRIKRAKFALIQKLRHRNLN
jgi:hypothetical protein